MKNTEIDMLAFVKKQPSPRGLNSQYNRLSLQMATATGLKIWLQIHHCEDAAC